MSLANNNWHSSAAPSIMYQLYSMSTFTIQDQVHLWKEEASYGLKEIAMLHTLRAGEKLRIHIHLPWANTEL